MHMLQIFRKVLDEVDIRIVEICKELHKKVVNMPQSVEQQKKFVKALINLSAISSNASTVVLFSKKQFTKSNQIIFRDNKQRPSLLLKIQRGTPLKLVQNT